MHENDFLKHVKKSMPDLIQHIEAKIKGYGKCKWIVSLVKLLQNVVVLIITKSEHYSTFEKCQSRLMIVNFFFSM